LLKAFIKIIGCEKERKICVNHWIRSCFVFRAILVGKTLEFKVRIIEEIFKKKIKLKKLLKS
jgi:hypothetical protein